MASLDFRTDAAVVGAIPAPAAHIMSFNVRRRMPHVRAGHPDAWEHRRALVTRLLDLERPSILGVQEALDDQSELIAENLGPRFASLGTGRNSDGSGERCTLFFDRDRFTVVDWAQLALSDTPDVAGSRSWGNLIPRIAVRADLLDTATGTTVRVVNTHFDHLSVKSRTRSARLLREVASAGSGAAVVMGDFNARPGSRAHRALLVGGALHDSWSAARERLTPEWSTFSGYKPPRVGSKRIDWVLVSGGVDVVSAAINGTRFSGAAASDHEPVHAVVRWGS